MMLQQGRRLFITGNSSGLGYALTRHYLEQDWRVSGCSRRGCEGLGGFLSDMRCDLTDFEGIPVSLEDLLGAAHKLDLVILNAGILGEIREISKTPLADIQRIMDSNVWANKVILDWLIHSGLEVAQVIMISSGASVLGNRGWGGYALSKAALNMLAKLYAHEMPDTHIVSLAPGLIDSDMMSYLCEEADAEKFPALNRLREARNSEAMQTPAEAAENIASVVGQLREFESGSFVDIRQILAPDLYSSLYGK
ncbi:MAG: SDR family NAD(P)-dependent oxidoreductase [Chromatiales bacterium]|jgi:NAD(P)-dependent dehydrogenase (short-subunit alcohol dehydrogenase family)